MRLRDFLARLTPEDVIVDIGANIGEMSILFFDYSPCQIHAIEPGPVAFAQLEKTVARSGGRVVTHRMGCSDRIYNAKMFHHLDWTLLPEDHPLQGEKFDPDRGHAQFKEGTPFLVNFTTLDDFVRLHKIEHQIAFIKIDTDGAEPQVIRGAQKTLETNFPALMIEFGESTITKVDSKESARGLLFQLVEMGYIVRICYEPISPPIDPVKLKFPPHPQTVDLFLQHPSRKYT